MVRASGCAALTYASMITATDATLDFTVEARADSDFTTNRLGFCVLHPAHLAGSPLSVEHGDGSVERAAFPEAIAPWQPFTDIRALIHQQRGATIRSEEHTSELQSLMRISSAVF